MSGGGWLLVHTEGPLWVRLAFIYQTWAFPYTSLFPLCHLSLNLVFPKAVGETVSRLDESSVFFLQTPLSLSGVSALATMALQGLTNKCPSLYPCLLQPVASLSVEALISRIRIVLTRAQVVLASVFLSHGLWFSLKE